MDNILIIGHFSFKKELLNGQTIKTKTVAHELIDHYGRDSVSCLDTHGSFIFKLLLPFVIFFKSIQNKTIIIMPGQNGLRAIATMLTIIKHFSNKQIHYVVIGGWLNDYLKNYPVTKRSLEAFNGIYVETSKMREDLETMGFNNIYLMPNFKNLSVASYQDLVENLYIDPPYRFCTFSRVMKEKGIEDAINSIKEINKDGEMVTLDIYGEVDSQQIDWFNDLLLTAPSCVKYCGMVSYDQSTSVLKKYYALLFPTHYEGEGFAGSIIDAYSAGIPVIATNWKYNSDLVTPHTGIIYEKSLTDAICESITNPFDLKTKVNCIEAASRYSPEKVMKVLLDNLG